MFDVIFYYWWNLWFICVLFFRKIFCFCWCFVDLWWLSICSVLVCWLMMKCMIVVFVWILMMWWLFVKVLMLLVCWRWYVLLVNGMFIRFRFFLCVRVRELVKLCCIYCWLMWCMCVCWYCLVCCMVIWCGGFMNGLVFVLCW